jgi:Fe-S-cluster containining protein
MTSSYMGGYAMLTDRDVKRLSPHYVRYNVVNLGVEYKYEDLYLAERQHPDGFACVAFRGRVGGPCHCRIYVDRPTVCREFTPGGGRCLAARRDFEDILLRRSASGDRS